MIDIKPFSVGCIFNGRKTKGNKLQEQCFCFEDVHVTAGVWASELAVQVPKGVCTLCSRSTTDLLWDWARAGLPEIPLSVTGDEGMGFLAGSVVRNLPG